MNKNKKGQIWTTDFIIGLVLFLLTLILGVRIILDMYAPEDYTKTYREAVHLSDTLLSAGYPLDWNESSVIMPGVTETNRINVTKLDRFNDLDYYRSKSLLHIDSDFIFFMSNGSSIMNLSRCTYGYNLTVDENCTPQLPLTYNNLVKVERTVIYNSTVYVMVFYTWS